MGWLYGLIAVVAIYAAHRLSCCAEDRGWIYYRKKRGRPGSAAQGVPRNPAETLNSPTLASGLELAGHFATDERSHSNAVASQKASDADGIPLGELTQRPRHSLLHQIVRVGDEQAADHQRPFRVAVAASSPRIQRYRRDCRHPSPHPVTRLRPLANAFVGKTPGAPHRPSNEAGERVDVAPVLKAATELHDIRRTERFERRHVVEDDLVRDKTCDPVIDQRLRELEDRSTIGLCNLGRDALSLGPQRDGPARCAFQPPNEGLD